ncbi:MAG: hypothetical protein ACRDNF_23605, partial [Streptosporangiaceae bacterium]
VPGLPGLPVLAGADLGSAALPAPVSLLDSAAPRGSAAPHASGTPRGAAVPHGPQPGATARGAAAPGAGHQADADAGAAGGAGDRAGGEGSFLLSPAVTIGCRVAMGVAMAFMLFIAI